MAIVLSGQSHQNIAQARASILRAIKADPSSAYALSLLCRIKVTYDWNFLEAENDCRRALKLDPKDADARHEMAMIHSMFGRKDETLEDIDAAITLSPTSYYKR